MTFPTNTWQRKLGTEVVMKSNGAEVADEGFSTCAAGTFETAAVEGAERAIFELDTGTGGFTIAPTAGAEIKVYEQKFNSNGLAAPEPDGTYRRDYVCSFYPDVAAATQRLYAEGPIGMFGGDFVIEWLDGGAGSTELLVGWNLRVTPYSGGPSA